MNKKGFTLIELIGTVVILSLALLILIPSVSRILKNGVEDADNKAKENIILAAKSWASDNKGILPQTRNSSVNVKVADLQSQGYIDENIKLPSTAVSLNSACVKITKTNSDDVTNKTGKKAFSYQYLDAC